MAKAKAMEDAVIASVLDFDSLKSGVSGNGS